VYVQELQNPVRPIVGVATSVAAFVGTAPRGLVGAPVEVNSWADYERNFGGLDDAYPLSYAVYLFFLNGGTTGLVVRNAQPGDTTGAAKLSDDITLNASSPGTWSTDAPGTLVARVNTKNLLPGPDGKPPANTFNLMIGYGQDDAFVAAETYPGANLTVGSPQYLPTLLAASQLVAPDDHNAYTKPPTIPGLGPDEKPLLDKDGKPFNQFAFAPGAAQPAAASPAAQVLGDEAQKTGIYALTKADIFNILCLPVDAGASDLDKATILDPAIKFCHDHRAMLIVDAPSAWSEGQQVPSFETLTTPATAALTTNSPNAAIYYPNLVTKDLSGAKKYVRPSGAVAGVWAATDTERGVWKAPAGTAATISGITGLAVPIGDGESGELNPIAINALRALPEIGPVVWGARTSVGADQLADQWKYIPVRRTALFIEESLRRGTQWVVFEPNDEPLWASIRLNVGAFMNGLFRKGAFQGSTPAEAYLVKCDKDNNPQDQIDLGIVNILVGFAPLKPAEFVIISIQQQAGQV
jgi:phage tail sheath protein FI